MTASIFALGPGASWRNRTEGCIAFHPLRHPDLEFAVVMEDVATTPRVGFQRQLRSIRQTCALDEGGIAVECRIVPCSLPQRDAVSFNNQEVARAPAPAEAPAQ